jgi:hypothetical protein
VLVLVATHLISSFQPNQAQIRQITALRPTFGAADPLLRRPPLLLVAGEDDSPQPEQRLQLVEKVTSRPAP